MSRWIARAQASRALAAALDRLMEAPASDRPVVIVCGEAGSGRHYIARTIAAAWCPGTQAVEVDGLPCDHPHGVWVPARDQAAAEGTAMIVRADDADTLRSLVHGCGAPPVIIASRAAVDLGAPPAVTLQVPPMRSRHADMPELVLAAARDAARAMGQSAPPSIDAPVIDALGRYTWSGEGGEPPNAAGLWHAMRCAVTAAGSGHRIELGHMPACIRRAIDLAPGRTLATMEREYVLRTVQAHDGRMSAAAASLGLSRHALWRRLRRWGVSPRG